MLYNDQTNDLRIALEKIIKKYYSTTLKELKPLNVDKTDILSTGELQTDIPAEKTALCCL